MMKRESIVAKLQKLDETIKSLEQLKSHSRGKILDDYLLQAALERNLQIASQVVLDIGNSILAERGIRGIHEYKDIIIRLGSEGIIPKEFSEKIFPIAGLRNLLVHNYLEIDPNRLVDILFNDLDDLKKYMKIIATYLNNQLK
ncbi:MAG: DUF86 domain-containing protein [Bacteroidota bacterium]|nr:DUF86 domain-containing protein [Bacteroidota bacterium]